MTAAIVFDLDGTLIDSAPDIAAAVNRMLADEGQPPLDLPTVTSFVGNGLPHLVERVLTHCNMDMGRHGALTRRTLDHYNRASSELTVVYPGVMAALGALRSRGYSMGICTNKPEEPARHVLQALGLDTFFDVVVGGDTLAARKPDPAPLRAAFDALSQGPRLYVGDSEVDANTARRAGVPFILFTEGYRKSAVEDLPHLTRYSNSADLPGIVSQVLAELDS